MVIPDTIRRLANIGKRVVLKVTPEGLLISPLEIEETEETQSTPEVEATKA
jgi:hypothetical protein